MRKRLGRINVGLLCLSALCCAGVRGGENIGWRTDGTGQYPTAQPPTAWAPNKGIVWKTPLPTLSNALPILVGQKLFVCAEPDTLICVDPANGGILWQKAAHGYNDVMTPERLAKAKDDEPKAAEMNMKQIEPLKKEMDALTKQYNPLQKELQGLNTQLKQQPDDAALKQALDDKRKQAAALKKTMDEKSAPITKLRQELAAVTEWRLPATHGTNGYSSPTPGSDGKNVFVLFGTGVAACYDLEGNRKWIKFVEKPNHPQGWGHSSSPVLCGDLLLVHVLSLTALNVATGEVVWNTKSPQRWGTAVITRIADENVAVMPNGDVVRVRDGVVLAKGLGTVEFCSPVVQDGVVYFTNQGQAQAAKLPAQITEPLKVEPLWKSKLKGERYYASPVVYDGRVYALSQNDTLTVLEAASGNLVYEQKLPLRGPECYPSLARAGKYLFASSEKGVTVVFEPGPAYKETAANTLEPFRSTPIFSGRRMYLRAAKNLYCIGE